MHFINKLILISLLPLCLSLTVQAQYQDVGNFTGTVLDMSQTIPGGSARTQGLGGAQTALGGDISSVSGNPAGLGFFNKSEISFSPSFNILNTSSNYLNNKESDGRLNLNFANLGIVINNSKGDLVEGAWRGGSFGFSMNRIASFQNQISYSGNSFNDLDGGQVVLDRDYPKDIIEYAVLNSQLDIENNFDYNASGVISSLAYNQYLTDIFQLQDGSYIVDRNIYGGNNYNIPAYPEPDFPTHQSETIDTRGGIYQTSASYGGNFNDKIYLGASISVLSLRKSIERVYTELPTATDLNYLELTENSELRGVGTNATLGLIVRPFTPILLGVSYTTPSYYRVEQRQTYRLETQFFDESSPSSSTDGYNTFKYSVKTPERLKGGVTYFLGKNGFATGEIEYVNYSSANVKNPSSDGPTNFDTDNNLINNAESVFNFKGGLEYRFGEYRIRGGYSYYEDPYSNDGIDESNSLITVGAGYRTRDYYFDLGISQSLGKESSTQPYPYSGVALIENKNTMATFSLGFFF